MSRPTTVMVTGGKGGVGKSTTATGLALALAGCGRVGLLDADLSGPSLPVMLGLPPGVQVTGGRMRPAVYTEGGGGATIAVMSTGLLGRQDTAYGWHGPLMRGLLRQFRDDVAWGDLDYLVLDTSPGAGEVHRTAIELFHPDALVMVTTPDGLAVSDTRRSARFFRDVVPMRAMVINGAERECSHCGVREALVDRDVRKELSTHAPVVEVPLVTTAAAWSAQGPCGSEWTQVAHLVVEEKQEG